MTTSSYYTSSQLAYASYWVRTFHRRSIPMTPKISINLVLPSPNHSQDSFYYQYPSS